MPLLCQASSYDLYCSSSSHMNTMIHVMWCNHFMCGHRIPALFRKCDTQIGRLKDGTKRDKQSVLINRFFKKDGGKLVSQEHSAYFRDLRSRCEEKYRDSREEGHHHIMCDSLSGCDHHSELF